MRAAVIIFWLVHGARAAAGSVKVPHIQVVHHHPSDEADHNLASLIGADFIVDLQQDLEIVDVDDEDDRVDSQPVKCLAPPCYHRAAATLLDSLPIPCGMRLTQGPAEA